VKTGSSYTTEIDTYNRNVLRVTRSGGGAVTSTVTARGDVDAYVDWLQLYPGSNKITFSSTGSSTVSCKINYRSGWIG
jgi:YbbR domain-containing protein